MKVKLNIQPLYCPDKQRVNSTCAPQLSNCFICEWPFGEHADTNNLLYRPLQIQVAQVLLDIGLRKERDHFNWLVNRLLDILAYLSLVLRSRNFYS